MGFKKVMPLIIILVLFLLGPTFIIHMLSSAEAGSSVTSTYQEQFNGTRDNTIITISMLKMGTIIVGVVILMLSVSLIAKRKIRF